ncbi:MAG: serine/threonine-protein kinase [Candidatus Zixiibacteriota bacterium]
MPQLSDCVAMEKMGAGPSGIVYKAWDDRRQRVVSLKWLRPEVMQVASFRTRCLTIAHRRSEFLHPGICAVYDVRQSEGCYALVTEFADGRPLSRLIDGGPLDNHRFLEIALRLAETLDFAHRYNIVHGNLKPTNIFVSADNKIKVTDFGLTCYPEVDEALGRHPSVAVASFFSPEQIAGHEQTPQSDFFSLGSLFYWLLSGRAPFGAGSIEDLLSSILVDEPDYTALLDANIPGDTVLLLKKLLAKQPDERFESAHELVVTLEAMRSFEKTSALDKFLDIKPRSTRQYLMISLLVALLLVFWIVVTTVPR